MRLARAERGLDGDVGGHHPIAAAEEDLAAAVGPRRLGAASRRNAPRSCWSDRGTHVNLIVARVVREVGEEPHPAPVRREERVVAFLRARDRGGLESIERPEKELRAAVALRGVDEIAA